MIKLDAITDRAGKKLNRCNVDVGSAEVGRICAMSPENGCVSPCYPKALYGIPLLEEEEDEDKSQ